MIVLRPASVGLPRVMMWLKPNRSLSRRGLRRLIVVLAVLALTTAELGAWQGNVFAPLFALVESAAMAIALSVAWRAGDRCERITLDESSLEVRSSPGRRCTSFQSYGGRGRREPGRGRPWWLSPCAGLGSGGGTGAVGARRCAESAVGGTGGGGGWTSGGRCSRSGDRLSTNGDRLTTNGDKLTTNGTGSPRTAAGSP